MSVSPFKGGRLGYFLWRLGGSLHILGVSEDKQCARYIRIHLELAASSPIRVLRTRER